MSTPVSGVEEQVWVAEETTFDTYETFASGDSLCVTECSIEPEQDWVPRGEKCGTASHQGDVKGQRRGSWSLKFYIKPKAAGTAPAMSPILKVGFGNETITGGTSVAYSLADSNPGTIQIMRKASDSLWEMAMGCVVEQIEIENQGGEIAMVTASGSFARYCWLYECVTDTAGYSISDTAITLGTGEGRRVSIGALVAFGAENNSGAGYRVTAVDIDTDTITISPGLAGNLAASALAVTPVVPAHSDTGSPLGGIQSSLSIDSTSIGFRMAKVTLNTGHKLLEGEATRDRAGRAGRGARSVTVEGEFYFLEENLSFLAAGWDGEALAFNLRIGPNTAASRMKVDLPKVRMDVVPVPIPESDEVIYTLTGVAQQNSTAADELTVTFD